MHPQLYRTGNEAFRHIIAHPDVVKESDVVSEVIMSWMSPFSGMSVVSNRETPFHRDVKSRVEWYDMLVTLGDYEDGRLETPNLGLRMVYNPGTVVGIAGKAVRHGVAPCKKDRVFLAYYMRDKVHERLQMVSPGWMTTDYYNIP
jgi:hypothetical protein